MYKEIKNKIKKYKEDKLERDIAKAKEKSERRRNENWRRKKKDRRKVEEKSKGY